MTAVASIGGSPLGDTLVAAVHDLHIWPMGTTDTVMTAHLVMRGGHPGNGFLADAQRRMHDRFGIGHVTLQIELEAGADCGECAPNPPAPNRAGAGAGSAPSSAAASEDER